MTPGWSGRAPRAARSASLSRSARAAARLTWDASWLGTSALVACTVLSGVAPPAVAFLSKLLFDELALGRGAGVTRATVLALASAAGSAALLITGYASGYVSALVQQRTTVYAEADLYGRVNSLVDLRPFEDPVFHNRLLLAERAVQQAPTDVTAFAVMAIQRGLSVTAYLGVLITLWPPMSLLLAVTVVPAILAHRAMARQQTAVVESTAAARRRHDYYSRLSTQPQSAKEIRVYGLGQLFQRRLVDALEHASAAELRQNWRTTRVEVFFALLNSVVVAISTVVAVRGVIQGALTLGDVVFFLAGVVAVQSAVGAVIRQLGVAVSSLHIFENYINLSSVTAGSPLGTGSAPPPLNIGIEFRDVWFRYDLAARWVLQGLDLHVPAGSTIGIVGENGAGKSTLVKLLLRLYEPERGTIFWDGVPLHELHPELLRKRVGVLFQDFVSYELSAAENVGLGRLESLHDLGWTRDAARRADIDDVLVGLRRGYETLLGRTWLDDEDEQGELLSGGQWQRVALARALTRTDADLLVLDEPNSSLDPESEYRIQELLQRFRVGRTSILVSHRLSALRSAQSIAVLHDGKVIEQGTHDELMQAGGAYARLFSVQARGYQDHRIVSSTA